MSGGGLSPFWVSWWQSKTPFTWEGPWWVSGWRFSSLGDDDTQQASICAAVMASDEDDAKLRIIGAHDRLVRLEWRFAHEREPGWLPFCDRFEWAKWMKWPWPATPTAGQTPGGGDL